MEYIKLTNVNKKIKGIEVLKNINLTVEQGEVVGLTGINGSGKSMLLRAVAGLIRVEGTVEIAGKRMEPGEFPDDIGVLIEMPGFLPEFTGRKNLQLLAMLQDNVSEEDIDTAMHSVGLDPDDGRHYKKYSLGMRERLGVAQAVLKKPKLILLDEPTNGIDESGVLILKKMLDDLREQGSTLLVASHDKSFLDSVCTVRHEMRGGKLV